MAALRSTGKGTGSGLQLTEAVGYNGSNAAGDLFRIQDALGAIGFMPRPDPGSIVDPHDPMFLSAIRRLQREVGEPETGVLTNDSAAARTLRDKLTVQQTALPDAAGEQPNPVGDFFHRFTGNERRERDRARERPQAKKGRPADEEANGANSAANPPDRKWRLHPAGRPFFSEGTRIIKTDKPVRIDRVSMEAIGVTGIPYRARWHLLDKDGKRARVFERRPDEWPNQGGHIFAAGGGRASSVTSPPFPSPHGWELQVDIPRYESLHGNSLLPYLQIFVAE